MPSLFRRRLDIFDVAARYRRKLLADEQKAVDRLLARYSRTQREIDARWLALEKKVQRAQAAGLEVRPSWIQRQDAYVQLMASIMSEMESYRDFSKSVSDSRVESAAILGEEHGYGLMRAPAVGSGFIRLPASAVVNITGYFDRGSPLREIFDGMPRGTVSRVESLLIQGIALGDNPREIGKKMARRVEALSKDRAITIARNESLRAYTSAQKALYEANADVVTGSMIVSAKDSRTCPMCWGQDGKILAHGESFFRHVGCRCALIPYLRYADMPFRLTGEQEFATLDPEMQLAILGPSRFELYNTGQAGLTDFYEEVVDPAWGPQLTMKRLALVQQSPASIAKSSLEPVRVITDEERILGELIEGQKGSNPGGVYLGLDGVKRYVKFYDNADKALAEHLAMKMYDLFDGVGTSTEVFIRADETVAIASKIIEGRQATIKDHAAILEGYAMDAFLAN